MKTIKCIICAALFACACITYSCDGYDNKKGYEKDGYDNKSYKTDGDTLREDSIPGDTTQGTGNGGY